MSEEEDNEDEYSASACEIMQRRSSSRRQSRRKRRPSSPFSIEAESMLRRRSSACTISSEELVLDYFLSLFFYNINILDDEDDYWNEIRKKCSVDKTERLDIGSIKWKYVCRTAISMEEGGSQEQIFEKLKLHKEVLSGVKQQPWPLRRKIKLVRQAKSYVRRHEGALQERLAHTRSTKDAIARVSLFATKVNNLWKLFK